MTETALIPAAESPAAIMERVVIAGDLAKLTDAERVTYYFRVCESIGLNPLTKPFDYITLNGKLTLYPNKDCAAQLRKLQTVSITDLRNSLIGDVYTVTVAGRLPNGREDVSTGAVNVKALSGESLANAYMKAETKAKRRLSLSLAGLGFNDESEVEGLAEEPPETPRKTLAEKAAEKAAAIQAVERVEVTLLAEPTTVETSASTDVPPWTRERLHDAAVNAKVPGSLVTSTFNDVAGSRTRAELTEADWREIALRLGLGA